MITLLLLILAITWWLSVRHPKNFPPGPRLPLPVLGDALSLKGNVVTGAENLRTIYGDVVGMWTGPYRSVYIHNFDILAVRTSMTVNIPKSYSLHSVCQDVFNGDSCEDRIGFNSQLKERGGGPGGKFGGVLLSSGKTWKEQRRHALHSLRYTHHFI